MCKLKSGIILKDHVFIPDYDSHTCMLKELGIEDNEINAKTLFVRAELSPINNDIFSDISTWKFNVDQDILPDWFVYEYDKQRMIEATKEWTKDHIFENIDGLKLKGNDKYYLKNCKNVKTYDSCEVIAYGNCTVYARNKSMVIIYDNCTVYTYDDCAVNSYNNCTVNAYNNCTVYTYDDCTVKAHDKCMVAASDNCTVYVYDDNENCTVEIEAYNNCKIINLKNEELGKR